MSFGTSSFGKPSVAPTTMGGFGTVRPTTGFGMTSTAFGGGFGSNSLVPQQQQQVTDPYFYHVPSLSDQSKCTGAGRYLMELENAYNAMHPNCKFRTFLYNMCEEGRGPVVIRSEIHNGQLLGGGAKESQWIIAKKENPDSERMVPKPVHFMGSLKNRTVKQQEMTTILHRHVDILNQKLDTLQQLNEDNAAMHRHLVRQNAVIESNMLSAMVGAEVLRQRGLPLGNEKHVIGDRVTYLLGKLRSPGMFKAAIGEMQPYVEAATYARTKAAAAAEPLGSGGSGHTHTRINAANQLTLFAGTTNRGLISTQCTENWRLGGGIDSTILADWTKFLDQMDVVINKLREIVEKDYWDVKKVKDHVEQHKGSVRN